MALNLTPGIAGTSIPHPRERRPMPEDDPENHLIKHLRVVKRMSWNGIVRHMNHERIKAGKEPSFTEAAVYGRFVRNGPRIAAREGDTDFDPRDYMHLRVKEKERRFLTGGGWGRGKMKDGEAEGDTFQEKWNARMDEILVEAYGEVTEELWVIVARRLADKTGMRFSAEGVAKRFHQI
ncbi:hypothetical protein M501DRAFT_937950 [Patellaria atrata CBS 101060]|uniref:Uncharacterized protein n=1 Tax=Patellaria atrata CBS 101060 TaxID=1346257 RepID=A0A9P4VN16_9PEZI|nr:hypothetical protein M501DRAFT_937950 [Patellaria atrata CBS 101060]